MYDTPLFYIDIAFFQHTLLAHQDRCFPQHPHPAHKSHKSPSSRMDHLLDFGVDLDEAAIQVRMFAHKDCNTLSAGEGFQG